MGDDEQPVGRPEQRERPNFRETAVRTDTNPLLLGLVRRWRRRLPGDERFGDPLSTAGEQPVHVIARQVSALQPDRPSALQEVGLGALQVWQSLSEASGRGRGDADVAILFTDLVGFSSWALEAGDNVAVELLREVGVVVEASVAERDGTIVKRLGDGVMAVFQAPAHAVEAALAMHQRLALIEVAGHRPRMRAGVHRGRPRKLGGDYLGVDVNIAARIGAAAGPGEVLVSDPACELLDHERTAVGRSKRLKAPGAPRDLRVCTVKRPG